LAAAAAEDGFRKGRYKRRIRRKEKEKEKVAVFLLLFILIVIDRPKVLL